MNKSQNNSFSLVIPIFNNGKTALQQLEQCYKVLTSLRSPYEVIICNDGSSDDTAIIVKKFRQSHPHVKILNHKQNKGIAPTLKELYGNASMRYTILFSVDGGWEANDIKKMVEKAKRSPDSIVIGRRIKKNYTLIRHLISFIYNYLPFILFNSKMHDVGSIKLFPTKLYKETQIISKSVFFEAEFLIKARKKGTKILYTDVSHKSSDNKRSGVNLHVVTASFFDMLMLRIKI